MASKLIYDPKKKINVVSLPVPKGRIIAVADIHGCFDELYRLIEKLKINQEDRLIFLGDLIDRGKSPNEVVQYIKNLSKTVGYCVMGNHDEKIVRYFRHTKKQYLDGDYKIPMNIPESYHSLSESSLEYLSTLPHAIMFDDFKGQPLVFCHAGMTYKKFDQDPQAFIRNRFISRDPVSGRLLPAQSKNVDGKWYVPEGAKEWYEYWDGRWKVVYGHSVYKEPKIANNTFGIDLGCCFGGYLCALILDPEEPFKFEYVKSNFKYEQQETEGV